MGNSPSNNTNESYKEIFKKYSPYTILGVSESDSMEQIIHKYRFLLKKHHPDKGGDIKKFNLVKEAFAEINLHYDNKQIQHHELKKQFEVQKEKFAPPPEPFQAKNHCDAKCAPIPLQQSGNEFLEKFNKEFQNTYLKNEYETAGYGNLDWTQYDNREKKFEIIPYESIHFNQSKHVYCESFDPNPQNDFSKYPNINEKNDLIYTDYLQAYTNNSCLLPEDHEKIWNEHFKDYHNRDLKKFKNQREINTQMTENEMNQYQNRMQAEAQMDDARMNNWKNWVDKQENHYKKNLLQ